ncbi:MAG: mechanosensitive ion channel [Candidatus Bathyarchaeia archaeon]
MAVLFVAGYYVIRTISQIIVSYGTPRLGVSNTVALKNLFLIAGWLILFLVGSSMFGVDLAAALVGVGFVGLVLGLAAQTVLSNLFAGIVIMISRPFKVGDRITVNTSQYGFVAPTYPHEVLIPGYTGIVKDIGMLRTRLEGDDNVPVSYPNSALIQAMIFNHSAAKTRTVRVRMDVNRDIPLSELRDAIIKALKNEPLIDGSRPIEVYSFMVSDDKYHIAITAWINSTYEEAGKAVIIDRVLDVMSELRRKAGTDVYRHSTVRVGDQVVVKGEWGTVEEVTPRYTIIRTWDNRRQVIPNHILDNEVVINYTLTDPKKLFPVVLFVPYDTDLEKAREIMVEEARKHPDVLKTLDPTFQVLDFTEGAIMLRLLFLAKDQPTAFKTGCDLRLAIKKRFDDAGIKLSCPTRYITPDSQLHVLNENKNIA